MLVSVIMPVYNASKYLAEAIQSVLNQTFQDFEIIVVDDGSIDETKRVIEFFKETNVWRIKYFFKQNEGPSSARNLGIQKATGKYLAFLDGDDIWMPDKLSLQVDVLNKQGSVGLVSSSIFLIDEAGCITGVKVCRNFSNQKMLLNELLVSNVVNGGASNVILRCECLKKVGLFDIDFRGSEDRDMWYRIAQHYQIHFVEEPLVKIRCHSGNASNDIVMIKSHRLKFINKHVKKVSFFVRQKALAFLFLDAAKEYWGEKNTFFAFINVLTSIFVYPFKIVKDDNKYLLLLKCFIPARFRGYFKDLLKRGQI